MTDHRKNVVGIDSPTVVDVSNWINLAPSAQHLEQVIEIDIEIAIDVRNARRNRPEFALPGLRQNAPLPPTDRSPAASED